MNIAITTLFKLLASICKIIRIIGTGFSHTSCCGCATWIQRNAVNFFVFGYIYHILIIIILFGGMKYVMSLYAHQFYFHNRTKAYCQINTPGEIEFILKIKIFKIVTHNDKTIAVKLLPCKRHRIALMRSQPWFRQRLVLSDNMPLREPVLALTFVAT